MPLSEGEYESYYACVCICVLAAAVSALVAPTGPLTNSTCDVGYIALSGRRASQQKKRSPYCSRYNHSGSGAGFALHRALAERSQAGRADLLGAYPGGLQPPRGDATPLLGC